MSVAGNPYSHLQATLEVGGQSFTYYNLKALGESTNSLIYGWFMSGARYPDDNLAIVHNWWYLIASSAVLWIRIGVMRIWIQLFNSMRIRSWIQGATPMRVHADPDSDPGQTLLSCCHQKLDFYMKNLYVGNLSYNISTYVGTKA